MCLVFLLGGTRVCAVENWLAFMREGKQLARPSAFLAARASTTKQGVCRSTCVHPITEGDARTSHMPLPCFSLSVSPRSELSKPSVQCIFLIKLCRLAKVAWCFSHALSKLALRTRTRTFPDTTLACLDSGTMVKKKNFYPVVRRGQCPCCPPL